MQQVAGAAVLMLKLARPGCLKGQVAPPADKSISHRALLLSALADGDCRISNLLMAKDVRSSWNCLTALGVAIERIEDDVVVHGRGGQFTQPRQPLYLGNSGTTMRLLTGVLAAQPLQTVLVGDRSLNSRPIQRVLDPLRLMGAEAYATSYGTPPVLIRGRPLRGLRYRMPVASAQLKSALLLAALQAEGPSVICDPVASRDHTERMLIHMGAGVHRVGDRLIVAGSQRLAARNHIIPGDFSSAAPFVVAAVLTAGSRLQVRRVGLNPTRTGLLSILGRMGAHIGAVQHSQGTEEPYGEIAVDGGHPLQATEVTADEIPLLIDEVPLLVVAACRARGITTIHGVAELRVKESDRVESIVKPLQAMGAHIEVVGNSMIVHGQADPWPGGLTVSAAGDHRIAMALAVAATVAVQPVPIAGAEWVDISYPQFFSHLEQLQEAGRCAF